MAIDRDPEPTARGFVEQQDDPDRTWQLAKRAVLERCDLKCERCGAEDRRQVWRYLYDDRAWWPFTPGQPPHRPDLYLADIRVLVVPVAEPWSGEVEDLQARCVRCWMVDDLAARRARKLAWELGPVEQQALF
jgi:hypothetical protein